MDWTTSNWFKEWEILAYRDYHYDVPKYKWVLISINNILEWKLVDNERYKVSEF